MTTKNKSFSAILEQFGDRYDLNQVFDDFLTIILAPLLTHPETGKQGDCLQYYRTMQKYDAGAMYEHFAPAFTELMLEIVVRKLFRECTDVLGEFYEQSILCEMAFMPWSMCQIAAQDARDNIQVREADHAIDLFVHDCNSGRMLVAMAGMIPKVGNCLGATKSPVQAKIAILNLLFNHVQAAEIVQYSDTGFQKSYTIRPGEHSIGCITDSSKSHLWKLHHKHIMK